MITPLTPAVRPPNLGAMKYANAGFFILVGTMAVAFMFGSFGCRSLSTTQPADSSRGRDQLNEGKRLNEQGLSDDALAAFTAALKENPRLVEAQMGIGDIYRKRGDYENAGVAYESATKLDPMSFEAHYYLGLMRQLMGRIEEAVSSYLRAIAIKPESIDANQNLASAYLQLNRPGDGLAYAKRAADLSPQNQAAWANLGATYSLLAQYDDAVDAYRHAAELGELEEPILLGLADAHIKLGHYDRAAAVLQTQLRKQPTATAYERLGYSQFKQRHYDDALASFRAALSLDANDVASLNGLGVALMTLYVQSGRNIPQQRDQALEAWRKSLTIRSNQPKIIDLVTRYSRL